MKCWGCVALFMLLADRTSCTAASSLRPEERVLQHPGRVAGQAVGCAACESYGQPCRCRYANSRAAAPSARPPKYPKAPPTPSAATATSPSSAATAAVSSMACAPPPAHTASSRRRSTSSGRPMICGGGCGCGPGGATHLGGHTQLRPAELGAEGLRRRSLGCCLVPPWPRALPWVQPWAPSWALWEISPSWDGRGSPLHTGRSSIIFFSSPGRRSFFCSSAGAARAAWACFYYPGACL